MSESRRSRWLSWVSLCCLLLAHVAPAAAQQSRADEYTDAQDEKAARPPGPLDTRGERIAAMIQALEAPPQGWFPFIGTAYPGSWLAVGPGYRKPFDNGAVFVGQSAWSLMNFKMVNGQMVSPGLAGGKVRLQVDASWLDAPKLYYYGAGNDTTTGDRMRFGMRPSGASALVDYTPLPRLHVSGGWGVEHYSAGADEDTPLPDVNATFATTTAAATLDWRPSPGWANSGGAVRVAWKGRHSLEGGDRSFGTYEAEATELIPILRGNWVIALHGLATMTTDAGDGDVPFFLLPDIGGPTSRGFANFRFRGRHRLATSAELRWAPSLFMDLALFVDAGRVAMQRRDLDFDGLHKSYGVGARFHTLTATVFRAEIARSAEGLRFTVGAGPVF